MNIEWQDFGMELLLKCLTSGLLFRIDEADKEICPKCHGQHVKLIQRFY